MPSRSGRILKTLSWLILKNQKVFFCRGGPTVQGNPFPHQKQPFRCGLGTIFGHPFPPGSVACNFLVYGNFWLRTHQSKERRKRRRLTPSAERFVHGGGCLTASARRRRRNFFGGISQLRIGDSKNQDCFALGYFFFEAAPPEGRRWTARRAVARRRRNSQRKTLKK